MWTAKIMLPVNEKMLIQSRAKKHKVSVIGYPLTRFWKNNKFYVLGHVFLQGSRNAKSNFLEDLSKDSRTVKIEMADESFGFFLVEQDRFVEIFYNPLIIHVKPGIITENGDTILEIASWDRKIIAGVARFVKTKLPGGKLLFIRKEKTRRVSIITAMPNLTGRQKRAIELAIAHGYYGYPRKADIDSLAKMMKVSYSTFQFHLRNAEKKLMPFVYGRSL